MVEPSGLLGEIVARKRRDVAARLGGTTLDELMARASPSRQSLAACLARPGARFIMEVKRASPSEGRLRVRTDPAEIARAYQSAADAVSVLVDEPYFGGSYRDLAAVRAAFDGPILAKDFVVDPRQVAEARLHGADAVLVMLSVLDDDEARTVIAAAAKLGMEVLVEAHDEVEVRRAVALDAPVIGINNRDLASLRVDLVVTERLAHLVPSDRLLVSESGITDRADVERLAPRVDAFLVGSALMKAQAPAQAGRTLAFGRVKLCGLTSAEDMAAAIAVGGTHVGLIFVPDSPRLIGLEPALPLVESARRAGVIPVGVFRNAEMLEVARAAIDLDLGAVQLHGDEDRAYLRRLRRLLPDDVEIWAACGVGAALTERAGADRLLFDTAVDGRSGGTGRSFDWALLDGHADLPRSLVAGGLNPDNIRAAAKLGAFALDVGSGVEAAPGRKDPAKLAALFAALRPTSRRETLCV